MAGGPGARGRHLIISLPASLPATSLPVPVFPDTTPDVMVVRLIHKKSGSGVLRRVFMSTENPGGESVPRRLGWESGDKKNT